MRWQPDPTFYPSPKMAMEAPAEKLAYVAMLNPTLKGRPDAMGVVDVDPGSKSYGKMVGRADMPNAGDELHHFGWNACSSCLCPYSPHPHMERRYLVVPGLRSSRIHILDTKPDPRNPKLVKVIEPETVMNRTGYSRPHTVHCGPEGIYMNALGSPDGEGPGGVFVLDARDVRRARALGNGPRAAVPGVRLRLAPGPRLHDHQRVGHAEHVRRRAESGTAAGRQVWPPDSRLGPAEAQAQAGSRPRSRTAVGVRTPAGEKPDERVRLRGRGDLAEGSVFFDLALVQGRARRERGVEDSKGDRDSRGAGRSGTAASHAEGLRGSAAARHRHQPLARRQVPLRLVLGLRRIPSIRRERSVPSEAEQHDPRWEASCGARRILRIRARR